ncbi:hypothetical protein D9M73_214980 [compost metagenome]
MALSISVLTATSVSHSVAGGTQERSSQPPAPTDRVNTTSITPRRQWAIGKLLARLGNDSSMAVPSANLKLCEVVRCRMIGNAVSRAANRVRVCSARNAQRRGASHL